MTVATSENSKTTVMLCKRFSLLDLSSPHLTTCSRMLLTSDSSSARQGVSLILCSQSFNQLTLSCDRLIQSTSYLFLGIPICPFPSRVQTKILSEFLLFMSVSCSTLFNLIGFMIVTIKLPVKNGGKVNSSKR
jgi:hypothetical protein